VRLSPGFLLKFFGLAAVLFALWSFAGAGDAYGRFVIGLAEPFIEPLTDCRVSAVRDGPKGITVVVSRADPAGVVYTRTIPLLPREIFSGIVPYLALMLATPGLAWRARARATAIGLAILVVFHVGLLMIGPFLTGLPQAHLAPETIRGVVQPVVNVIYGFYGLIGYAALPFLLWFWLGARGGGMSTAARGAAVDPAAVEGTDRPPPGAKRQRRQRK